MASTGLTRDRPLLDLWPSIEGVEFATFAELPTPVTSLAELMRALDISCDAYDKRDDLTSPIYGGNKVRTLEVLLGRAHREGCSHVYSTGAYGTNHGAAATMHAPRIGLAAGVVVYPQPHSPSAIENLELMLSRLPTALVRDLFHWSALPFGMVAQRWASRRIGERAMIMDPGGAVPHGALGYVSAALEFAHQIAAGDLPLPTQIVVATGSNCTTAGLLVGLRIAARYGIGFDEPPMLTGVRVTPWPVTSRWRILSLARRTARLLHALTGDEHCDVQRVLPAGLTLSTRYIARGYGFASDEGRRAIELFREHAGHLLETTYSGKSAAAFIDIARESDGPVVYWSTKTSTVLPPVDRQHVLDHAPRRMRRWLERGHAMLPTVLAGETKPKRMRDHA